ncbi:MAG: hypothetical protein HZB23_00765 [Deltaproteobacteria bacterium]|nr:hypothetical protein [Deltaproteobacteria bacterium]
METVLKALLVLSLAASVFGCVTVGPPQRIQDAVHTANRYMPEYVAESNKALAASEHPDRERLTGIGTRLVSVMKALDRWASGQETNQKEVNP